MKTRLVSTLVLCAFFQFGSFADNFWKDLKKDILNPKPSVSNIKVATDVQNGEAVNEATEFPPDTEKIYVWFNFGGISADSSIETIWFFSQNQKLKDVGRTSYKVKLFDTFGTVFMIKPEGGWLPGDYVVQLRSNNQALGKISFLITGGTKKASNQINYGNLGDNSQAVEEFQETPVPAAKSGTTAKKNVTQARGTAADAEFIKQQVGSSIHNEQTKFAQYQYNMNREICAKVGTKGCPKCGFDNITRRVDFNAFTITCPACGKYSLSVAKLKNDDGFTYQEAMQKRQQEMDANILKFRQWGNAELQKKGLPAAWDLTGAAAENQDNEVTVEEFQDSTHPAAPRKKAEQQTQPEDFSF